ncbi:hypothetical protein PR048_016420 [Dryococelus australis]|uniref:Uncharacterized protein n=1 Tax=Dryococelus australis TaxID=614101 RepID=A0ABQ9HJN5_9NEOP|nr:hypothetical protein PR048_016420 [Dryococelus australis]
MHYPVSRNVDLRQQDVIIRAHRVLILCLEEPAQGRPKNDVFNHFHKIPPGRSYFTRFTARVSEEVSAALKFWVFRADEREVSAGMQGGGGGGGEREIPEKTRRPAASSGTIPTYENVGVTRSGIEPGSPWWEASSLTAQLPQPLLVITTAAYGGRNCILLSMLTRRRLDVVRPRTRFFGGLNMAAVYNSCVYLHALLPAACFLTAAAVLRSRDLVLFRGALVCSGKRHCKGLPTPSQCRLEAPSTLCGQGIEAWERKGDLQTSIERLLAFTRVTRSREMNPPQAHLRKLGTGTSQRTEAALECSAASKLASQLRSSLDRCYGRVCMVFDVWGKVTDVKGFSRHTNFTGRIPVTLAWSGEIWAAINIEVLRADEGEVR